MAYLETGCFVAYIDALYIVALCIVQAPVARKVNSAILRISLIQQLKLMQLSNKLYPLDGLTGG